MPSDKKLFHSPFLWQNFFWFNKWTNGYFIVMNGAPNIQNWKNNTKDILLCSDKMRIAAKKIHKRLRENLLGIIVSFNINHNILTIKRDSLSSLHCNEPVSTNMQTFNCIELILKKSWSHWSYSITSFVWFLLQGDQYCNSGIYQK